MERIAGRVCIIIISLFLFGFFSMTKMNEKIFITVRVAIHSRTTTTTAINKQKNKTKSKTARGFPLLLPPSLFSILSSFLFCLFLGSLNRGTFFRDHSRSLYYSFVDGLLGLYEMMLLHILLKDRLHLLHRWLGQSLLHLWLLMYS